MVKNLFILLLLLSTQISFLNAYAHPPKIWFQNEGSFLSHDTVTNGEMVVEKSLFGGYDLENLVSDNPHVVELVRLHKNNNTYAALSFVGGLISALVIAGVGISQSNTDFYYASYGVLFGGIVLSAHFISKSHHYLYEAINEYNGIARKPSAHAEFSCPVQDSKKLYLNLITVNF